MNFFARSLAGLAAIAVVTTLTFAADEAKKPAYPLTTCIVDGGPLPTDESVAIETIDGREVRFCCAPCSATFKKDAATWHKKLDDAIIAATKDSYPLKTCIVADEDLGSMGDPVLYVHRPTNQLVKFCCKSCTKPFQKDAEKLLKKLEAPAKK